MPPRARGIDISGQVFGRLTAVGFYNSGRLGRFWLCSCECGRKTLVHMRDLRSGHIRSCGCLAREVHRKRHLTHGNGGKRPTTEYRIWGGMKSRCLNKNQPAWKDYGGRGITVCDRWMKFENFLADMGPAPVGFTLERINNNGNYEPSNCCWASRKDQAKNRRMRRSREELSQFI